MTDSNHETPAAKFFRSALDQAADAVAAAMLNQLVDDLRRGDIRLEDIEVLSVGHWPTCAYAKGEGICNCARTIEQRASGWEVNRG